jgi:hypothetical protein
MFEWLTINFVQFFVCFGEWLSGFDLPERTYPTGELPHFSYANLAFGGRLVLTRMADSSAGRAGPSWLAERRQRGQRPRTDGQQVSD